MALSDLRPTIFGDYSEVLTENIHMARLVGNNLAAEAAEIGDTVNVPIDEPASRSRVQNVTDGLTPTGAKKPVQQRVPVVLDQHREAYFYMDAKTRAEVLAGVIPSAVRTEGTSLALDLNYALMRYALRGAHILRPDDPFESNSLAALGDVDARAAYLRWGRRMPRYFVISPEIHGQLVGNSSVSDFDGTGRPVGDNVPYLTMQRGYNFIVDPDVTDGLTVAAGGTRKSGATFAANGAVAVGDDSMAIDAVGNVIEQYDVVSLDSAGRQPIGTVSSQVAANGTTIEFYEPGALREVADDARLYVQSGAGTNNFVFLPGAFKLGMRVLADPDNPDEMVGEDPITGLPVCMTVWRGHKGTRYSFNWLYGAGLVDPNRIIRMIG